MRSCAQLPRGQARWTRLLGPALLLPMLLAPPAVAQSTEQTTEKTTEQSTTQRTTERTISDQTALLFDTPHLEQVAAGTTLDYDVHAIRTDGDSGTTTETLGRIALATQAGAEPQRRTIEAELTRDGHSRTLDPFLSVRGNPVLIIFLEQVLQDISRETGGSSNYLRNRLRDGMATGLSEKPVPDGTLLVMHPLASDPNSEQLGEYANLEISFLIDSSLPGMLGALTAKAGPETAPIFLEEVTYDVEG